MRTVVIAICLVLFAQLFAHTEDFAFLEESYAGQVSPDPVPQKLFKEQDVQHVKVTAYTPDPKENWGGKSGSAFGTKLTPGTIAVSRDLYKRGWKKGRKVYVKGLGVFEVNDLMHKRHRNKIDVLLTCKKHACDFGVIAAKAFLLAEGN